MGHFSAIPVASSRLSANTMMYPAMELLSQMSGVSRICLPGWIQGKQTSYDSCHLASISYCLEVNGDMTTLKTSGIVICPGNGFRCIICLHR
jgi:hypothetical protein